MKGIQFGNLLVLTLAPLATLLVGCDRHPHAPNGEHSLGRVEIIDRGQTERPVVASWTPIGGWTGSLPRIGMSTPNQRISLGARIYNDHDEELTLSETGEYSVRWALAPGATPEIIVTDDSRGDRFHGDHVHIYGHASGSTRIQFVLWHVDHADGETTSIAVEVVD